jgi:gas vesicle structural protein
MTTEATTPSVLDILDRVLDKGIVVDAWLSISVAGLNLATIEARVIVSSFATHLKYAEEIQGMPSNLASGLGGSGLSAALG